MSLDKVNIKVDKTAMKASIMDKTSSHTKFQKAMEESIIGNQNHQPEIINLEPESNKQEEVTSQNNIEEYKKELTSLGLREEDIEKVISGNQTIEGLMEEIETDQEPGRKKEVMYATYLKQFGYEYSSMEELKEDQNNKERKLEELKEEKKNIEKNREYEDIMSVIVRLQNGEKLDYIIKNEVVAWEVTDSEGNIEYVYEDPSNQPNDDGTKKYRAVLFEEMYPNNESINKLREVLENNDGRWINSEEQNSYIKEFENSIGTKKREKEKRKEEIEKEIEETYNEKEKCKGTYEYITKEVDYYIENVDKYLKDDKIMNNTEYKNDGENKIENLLNIENYESDGTILQYKGKEPQKIKYITDSRGTTVEVNDKEELTLIIYTMLNESGKIEDDGIHLTKEYNGVRVNITSNDSMLNHYRKWKEEMTDKEKEIFNGKYQAEGYESAYKYLEDISEELDNRWLMQKTQEDQEFADNHPALASIGSIIKTPFEGISAACHTLNTYMSGENIKRTDIYSAGDVWRSEVSKLVSGTYGEGWAFTYNTGMSMADTGGMIAASAVTGGGAAATTVLSTSLMGSRVYVSTLNEAKDRGLEDKEAVLLAASAAITESAMESYSAGHLLNIEEKLGKGVAKSTEKLAESIKNKTLSNIISKGYYLAGGAVSQGICEGEEELATEIVNYVTDRFISKDLSNYEQSISKYLELGYTDEEALASTMKDFSGQAGQAFLGGMISGACFGTFGGAKTLQNTSNNIAINMIKKYEGKTYKELLSENENSEGNTNKKLKISDFINKNIVSALADNGGFVDLNVLSSDNQAKYNMILDEINSNSNDIDSFGKYLEKIRTMDEASLPEGYSSVEEYKKFLTNVYIESGKINELDGLFLLELAKDNTMIKELIQIDKLTKMFTLNFDHFSDMLIGLLNGLNEEELNIFFNSDEMKSYINKANTGELSKIINAFNKANNIDWISCGSITEKIMSMNSNEFYELIKLLKNVDRKFETKIKNLLKDSSYEIKYNDFMNNIIEKFYKPEILMEHFDAMLKVRKCLPCLNFSNLFEDMEMQIKANVITKINSISDIKINKDFYLSADEEYKWYTLEVEKDGKVDTYDVKKNDRKLIEKLVCQEGTNIKLKSFKPNKLKSALCFDGNTLINGVNTILVNIDGKLESITVKKNHVDLDISGMNIFENANNVEVLEINKIGDKNITVDKKTAYNVKAKIDGKDKEFVLCSTKNLFDKNFYLDINNYMVANNVKSMENIEISEATSYDIQKYFPKIDHHKNSANIMNEKKYGGNQSAIPDIMDKYLNHKTILETENKRAQIISKLMTDKFGNISDFDQINLSEHFANGGCSYVAIANAFFTYMNSLPNGKEIFKNIFGFEMCVENNNSIVYTIEELALDIYLENQKELTNGDIKKVNLNILPGITDLNREEVLINYFSKKGISIDYSQGKVSTDGSLHSLLEDIFIRENDFYILNAKNFDLFQLTDNASIKQRDGATKNSSSVGRTKSGIGAHSMLITGLDEENNLIVSSWEDKYKYMHSSVEERKQNKIEAGSSVYGVTFSINK